MSKTLIVIVGPTAIGKTSLSIKLAQYFNCEIISADSRQFYKEMNIGTAVPNAEELSLIPHHFIQHISITDTYSVGDFEKKALEKINELFQRENYAILVGGSGLYLDAVTRGLDYFPEVLPEIRTKVRSIFDEKGIQAIQQELKKVDPVQYEAVDLNNTQRVLRALEVSISSGKPYSSFLTDPTKKRPFKILKIGLTAERSLIYERINQRVDIMIANNLLEEAKTLYPHKSLNALNTVGYKELFQYLDEEQSLEFAISEIKKNTRRFSKRQLTWFRKDLEITWFDYETKIDPIVLYIKNSLQHL